MRRREGGRNRKGMVQTCANSGEAEDVVKTESSSFWCPGRMMQEEEEDESRRKGKKGRRRRG